MTRPIYIVSIRRIDSNLPIAMQDMEIFKTQVCPSDEEADALTRCKEELEELTLVDDMLLTRVDQIQRIALGTLTVDEGEEQQ